MELLKYNMLIWDVAEKEMAMQKHLKERIIIIFLHSYICIAVVLSIIRLIFWIDITGC